MKPEVGQWYESDHIPAFEVVAYEDECIEIQYEDGAVEEFDDLDWDFEVEDGNLRKIAPVIHRSDCATDAADEEEEEV